MIIQDKNTATGELSYFETTLLLYLKESHPHIAGDKALVRARADETEGSYERAIHDYPLRRLCNWPRPFSIKTFALPDSIRFSRSCRSGFPKCGPKNGRVSA